MSGLSNLLGSPFRGLPAFERSEEDPEASFGNLRPHRKALFLHPLNKRVRVSLSSKITELQPESLVPENIHIKPGGDRIAVRKVLAECAVFGTNDGKPAFSGVTLSYAPTRGTNARETQETGMGRCAGKNLLVGGKGLDIRPLRVPDISYAHPRGNPELLLHFGGENVFEIRVGDVMVARGKRGDSRPVCRTWFTHSGSRKLLNEPLVILRVREFEKSSFHDCRRNGRERIRTVPGGTVARKCGGDNNRECEQQV